MSEDYYVLTSLPFTSHLPLYIPISCDRTYVHYIMTVRLGYLDADAIRRAMGAGISDLEVAEMIAEVDEEGTGKIQYDDFVKLVSRYPYHIIDRSIVPHYRLLHDLLLHHIGN